MVMTVIAIVTSTSKLAAWLPQYFTGGLSASSDCDSTSPSQFQLTRLARGVECGCEFDMSGEVVSSSRSTSAQRLALYTALFTTLGIADDVPYHFEISSCNKQFVYRTQNVDSSIVAALVLKANTS